MLTPEPSIFDRFAAFTRQTAIYPGVGTGGTPELSYLGLGLAGEAGEVADALKKIIRLGNDAGLTRHAAFVEAQRAEAVKELGDVFWYAFRLAAALGTTPEAILAANMEKLAARAAAGELAVR